MLVLRFCLVIEAFVPAPEACKMYRDWTIPLPFYSVQRGGYFKFPFGRLAAGNVKNWTPQRFSGSGNQGKYVLGTANSGDNIIGFGNSGSSIMGNSSTGTNVCGDESHGENILGNGLGDMRASESKREADSDWIVFSYVPKASESATFTLGFVDHNCPGDDFDVFWNIVPSITTARKIISGSIEVGVFSDCNVHIHSPFTVAQDTSNLFSQAKTTVTLSLTAGQSIYFILNPTRQPYGGGTAYFYLKKQP